MFGIFNTDGSINQDKMDELFSAEEKKLLGNEMVQAMHLNFVDIHISVLKTIRDTILVSRSPNEAAGAVGILIGQAERTRKRIAQQ